MLSWSDSTPNDAYLTSFDGDLGSQPINQGLDVPGHDHAAIMQQYDAIMSPPIMPHASASASPPQMSPRPLSEQSRKASPSGDTSSSASRSKPSKVEKTFHFVANDDKRTATRIRNTMASRKLRDSKVSRIAALERELEAQAEELKLWRQRAIDAGWKGGP